MEKENWSHEKKSGSGKSVLFLASIVTIAFIAGLLVGFQREIRIAWTCRQLRSEIINYPLRPDGGWDMSLLGPSDAIENLIALNAKNEAVRCLIDVYKDGSEFDRWAVYVLLITDLEDVAIQMLPHLQCVAEDEMLTSNERKDAKDCIDAIKRNIAEKIGATFPKVTHEKE